jgi:cellulose synthase operon protein C
LAAAARGAAPGNPLGDLIDSPVTKSASVNGYIHGRPTSFALHCALIVCNASLATAAVAQDMERVSASQALLHSARLWEAHDRGDLAQLALEKLVAARADSPQGLQELGELDLRLGRVAEAARVLDQIESRFQGTTAARDFELEYRLATRERVRLASIQRLIELERGAEARVALDRLFPQGAPDSALGIEYYRLLASTPNGWSRSYDGFKRLVELHPDDPRYRFALARHQLRRPESALEGAIALGQLAQHDDVRVADVDQLLASSITQLGYRRVPTQVVHDYLLRHPNDPEVTAVRTQQERALEEQRLLSRNALAAVEPELQRRLVRQLRAALDARRLDGVAAGHALALAQLAGPDYPENEPLVEAVFDDATLAAALWHERSRRSMQARREGLAAAELRAALAFHRKDYEAQIAVAEDIDAQGAAAESGELLASASGLDPQSSWLFESRARWLIDHGHAADAVVLLQRRALDRRWTARARDALLASALDQLAAAKSTAGDVAAAIADLDAAIQIAPRDPWMRFRLARLYRTQQALERGRALMSEGVRLAPDVAEMRYAQALYLSSLEDYPAAFAAVDGIDQGQRTAGMNALRDQLQVALARASARHLKNSGDTDAARAALLEVEPLATHDIDRARELAYAWIEIGEAEHGISLFDAARTGAGAGDSVVLLTWAQVLNRAEDSARLGAALNQLRSRPSLSEQERLEVARLQRALELRTIRSLKRERRFGEAARRLDELLAREPQDRSLRVARADLDMAAGQPRLARDRYAALVDEQPEDLDTRLSYVRALTDTGDIALARLQLQAVEGQVPADDVELRLSLARRQLALHEASAALLTLHALTAISPPRADVLLLAGRAELAQRHFAIAHDYFEQAKRAAEGDDVLAARDALEGIEARLQSGIAAALLVLHEPGKPGLSQLDAVTIPTSWLLASGYEQRFTVRADVVTLDIGRLSGDFNSAALLGTTQAAGPSSARHYSNDRQSGLSLGVVYQTDALAVDVGSTPLGFLLPNIVGGIEWSPTWNSADVTLGLARRAVTGSELSYAGLRDPITGKAWGAVVQTGPYAGIGLYRERYSISGSVRFTELAGTHVLGNQFFGARGAADWKFFSRKDVEADIGLTLKYWNYQHNLANYTFGSGGYYSPQSYVNLAVPLELSGARAGWIYRLRMSVAYSLSDSKQIAFYPNDAALQSAAMNSPLPSGYDAPFFAGGRSSAISFSAYAAFEREVAHSLVLGAMLDIDRTDYYHPTVVSLYVRHAFAPWTPRAPPRPTRPYNP